MRKQFIILILSLLILNGCVFSGQQAVETITSFEECLKAGNPVMESYPRQCRAGSTAFTEDIGNELAKMDLIRLDSPRPNAEVVGPIKYRKILLSEPIVHKIKEIAAEIEDRFEITFAILGADNDHLGTIGERGNLKTMEHYIINQGKKPEEV